MHWGSPLKSPLKSPLPRESARAFNTMARALKFEVPVIPEKPLPPYMKFKSLGLLSSSNPVRRWADRTTNAPWFEPFVVCCVIVNSVCMAMWDPLAEGCDYHRDGG